VLQGDFAPGDTIRVDSGASSDMLTFSKVRAQRAAGAAAPQVLH